jgi:hypothetical protein
MKLYKIYIVFLNYEEIHKFMPFFGFTLLLVIITNRSLKVPERYEKCLRVSTSVKRKPLPASPSGREWATS